MKFVNLLTLLAATSAFALNFKREDQLEQLLGSAQGEQGDDTAELAEFMECLSVLSDFMEKCYGVSIKSFEEFQEASNKKTDCKLINSNECQNLLKDPNSGKCGGTLSSLTPSMNLYCATDENGEICPFSKIMQSVMEKVEKDQNAVKGNVFSDKDIEETCKSKKCTEEAINTFNEMKKNGMASSEEDQKEMDSYIAKLSEDKCKAAATSGATQIKVGSALLATLALAFYFF